ncbi:hypothetical protein LEN26_005464 [Aphanomyces euteiches]|nr:hypothetical protein AeMF1_000401 [Aphanomyces euteiches]KAH9138066.1 hypothetical protein LEN26_005464 [Aphanomyces euteiches]
MVKVFVSLAAVAAAASAGSITDFPTSVSSLWDTTADPCVDFYQYACGGWYKTAVIPADRSYTDTSFSKISAENDAVIAKIFKDNKPKLGDFYNSCTDTATLTSLGITPLKDAIAAINSANSTQEAADVIAELSRSGIPAFSTVSASADDLDTTTNALFAKQNELPLDLSYYTDATKWSNVEAPYKQYITDVLTLAGLSATDAAAAANVVTKFERQLAGVQLTKVQVMESVTAIYTQYTFAEANAKYPLSVGALLRAYGLNVREGCNTNLDKIAFYDLSYFNKAESLLKSTSVADLKTVVLYKLINAAAPNLTPQFHTTNWKFFGQVIGGQKTEPTREKFCASQADAVIGEILGKYYMDEVFTADTATRADDMVKALEASFKTGIESADWLDSVTRTNALTKLSKFQHLLGGPTNPKLYPDVTLDSKSYINNLFKIAQSDNARNIKLIGTKVDKSVWGMTPQTVNAYYDPTVNEIVFPAAILQNPFFDKSFDPAQNFGAMGMVIGHEITHGFDNSGRNYDGDGNLNPWWSSQTAAAFTAKASCIQNQYGNFTVKSETSGKVLGNVNGRLSLGETIADNGGLKTSYRAYKEYLKTHDSIYTTETGDKLFYLAFAQGWCSKNTDARLNRLLTDPHPPGQFRVIGALQNNAQFAKVFNCPSNTYMNPDKKCPLWE